MRESVVLGGVVRPAALAPSIEGRCLVCEIRRLTRRIRELEHEISLLVADLCPQLVALPGCGPLTAAKLLGEIAGADRFSNDAKLARAAGVAPIPASSGRRDRHRLDRGGNRHLKTSHCTASPSTAPATTPRPRPTSPANTPKE